MSIYIFERRIFLYEKYVIARDEAGITDYRVAKDTGISTASLSNWKKNFETDGKSGYKPKADKLKVLAEYFHKPIEYFFE